MLQRVIFCKNGEHSVGCFCKIKKGKSDVLVKKVLSYKKAIVQFGKYKLT